MKPKAIRVVMTMPADTLAKVDRAAKEMRVTRSRFMKLAVDGTLGGTTPVKTLTGIEMVVITKAEYERLAGVS